MTDPTTAFVLMIGHDGTCDMRAGNGISKQQVAKWLRYVADSLDDTSEDHR